MATISKTGAGRGRWTPTRAVAVVAAWSFALSLVVHRLLWPHLTGNNDEAVYLFQADLLRTGRLTLPVDGTRPFFQPWLSGVHDDSIIFAFQPVWPALLAAADVLTGSPVVASAAAMAVVVAAMYRLAARVLDDDAKGAVAAAMLAATPILVIQSGAVLPYIPMLAALLVAAATILRAQEDPSANRLLLAGLATGLAFLLRPFDSLLFLAPFWLWTASTLRSHPMSIVRWCGWAALGMLPGLAISAALNTAITGSAITFPISVAGGANRFGFGWRSVAADTGLWDYQPNGAIDAQATNISALPTWALGWGAGILIAAIGLWRLRHRPKVLVLLLGSLLFPIGYGFWWATILTAQDPFVGIGPHYLLPCFVTLAALGADTIVDLVRADRQVGWAAVAALLVLTGWTLAPKVDHALDHTARMTLWAEVADGDLQLPAIAIVADGSDSNDAPYVLHPIGILGNDPDNSNDVLYAADLGPALPDVLKDAPGRSLYRFEETRQPDGDLFDTTVIATPLTVLRGGIIWFDVTVPRPQSGVDVPVLSFSINGVSVGSEARWTADTDGRLAVRVGVTADHQRGSDPGRAPHDPMVIVVPGEGELRATLSGSSGQQLGVPVQYRQQWRLVDGQVEVVFPGTSFRWWELGGAKWLRWELAARLEIAASAEP